MTTKALNFKLNETEISNIRKVAAVFNMTLTDVVREAIKEYVNKMQKDPFYRLTAKVQEASKEESEEILNIVENLSDDDMCVTSSKRFSLKK